MAITAAMRTQVSQLYVALFGRAPDSDGLGYWVNELGNGKSLTSVADTMYATAPARAYYPTWKTNEEIISSFYVNVLGRTADAEGLAYWTAKLNAAGATPGSVIAQMIEVVSKYTGTDAAGVKSAALFNNKTDVAQTYAEAGGTIANATSILSGVTDVASTVTAAKATISGGAATSSAGQSFDLTANVENASGTSGDDIFNASTTDSGATLNTGDVINGGSGTDTLKITAQGVSPIVQLNSVEVVDVRMLSATQTLNAISWSGVTQVNVNSNSIDDTTLTVTNANQSTQFRISDDANIVIDYLDDSGTTDTARLFVDAAGVDSSSPATFTISATEAVNLGVSGTTYVAISAGDTALKDVTVSGVGTLSLDIAETSLSGLSLAGFSGTSTVTLGAASNVNLTGGAGNDTFKFGSTFNGLDKVDGGAGTNVIEATLSGIVGFTNVKNVQTGNFNVGGTTVADASGTSFSTLNISGIGSTDDLTINNIGTVVLNLSDTASASDLSFDYAAGANATINLKSKAAETYSAIAISDASGVTLSNVAASNTQTIIDLSVDADAKSLSIVGNSGTTVLTNASGAGLTSLSVAAGQSGTITSSTFVGSAITSVNVTATGASANATMAGLSLNTGTHVITASVDGGNASASLGNLVFGASGRETVTLTASGSGASVRGGTVGNGATGVMSISVDANGASSVASVGAITGGNSGNTTLSLRASGAAASGLITSFNGGTAATTTITLNLIGDSNAKVGDITIGNSAAALTVSVAALASGDVTFSSIAVGLSNQSTPTTLDFAYNLGSGTLNVATAEATTITSISGVAGNNGSARIAAISANAISSINLSGSGKLEIGSLLVSGSIGPITVNTGVFSAGTVTASGIGAITVEGDGFTLKGAVDTSIGNIVVGGNNSGAVTITNATKSASFGTITLGGTGTVTIDLGNATGVGAISTVSLTGEFNLDAGSATGQVLASLGGATSDITVSVAGSKAGLLNGDIYTLSSGTGTNYFRFQATSNNDVTIQNFQVGTGVDRLYFGTAGFDLGQGTANSIAASAAGALGVAFVTGASADISMSTQVIVLATGTYADASAVAVALKSTYTAQAATATTAGLDFIVVWADTAGDTHISTVDLGASASQGGVLFTAVGGTNFTDLAVLDDTGLSLFSGGTQFYSY